MNIVKVEEAKLIPIRLMILQRMKEIVTAVVINLADIRVVGTKVVDIKAADTRAVDIKAADIAERENIQIAVMMVPNLRTIKDKWLKPKKKKIQCWKLTNLILTKFKTSGLRNKVRLN